MTNDELKYELEQRGYKLDPDESHVYSMFKRSNSTVYCACNEKPPQLRIDFYSKICDIDYTACDISICAENNKSEWIDFKFYGISRSELLKRLPEFEYKLQRAWESIN